MHAHGTCSACTYTATDEVHADASMTRVFRYGKIKMSEFKKSTDCLIYKIYMLHKTTKFGACFRKAATGIYYFVTS
jgi:hypothetical protein